MKRPLLTALLAISLTLPVSAQEPSFYSLLISPARPAKLKVSELPSTFKAVRLQVQEGGGLGGLVGGSSVVLLGMFSSLFGSSSSDAPLEFLNVIDISWTNGETVQISGQDYLVTYKLGMGLPELVSLDQTGRTLVPELKLTLVRTAAIQTISPEPQLTRAQFLEALNNLTMLN